MHHFDYRVTHLQFKVVLEGSEWGVSKEDSAKLFEAVYRWKADQISNDTYDDRMADLTHSIFGDEFLSFTAFAEHIHDLLDTADVRWCKSLYSESKPQAA